MNNYFHSSKIAVFDLNDIATKITCLFGDRLKASEGLVIHRIGRSRPYRIINEQLYLESDVQHQRPIELPTYLFPKQDAEYRIAEALVNKRGQVIIPQRVVKNSETVLVLGHHSSRGESSYRVAELFVRACFNRFLAYTKNEPLYIELASYIGAYTKEGVFIPAVDSPALFNFVIEELENYFRYIQLSVQSFCMFNATLPESLPIEAEWLTYDFQLEDGGETLMVARGRDKRILMWEEYQDQLRHKQAEEDELRRCT